MTLAPNAPCPCGSDRKHKKCCRPILQGRPAPTPEALMRSRYTGYVAGDTGHILATTHPDSPHHQADAASWAAQVASFCQGTTFEGLQVEHTHQEGDRGWVRFEARIRQNGRASSLREHSEFHRVDGQWLYLEGTDPSTP